MTNYDILNDIYKRLAKWVDNAKYNAIVSDSDCRYYDGCIDTLLDVMDLLLDCMGELND